MEDPPPPPPPPQLRSLRDFLLVYNRMTELCFRRCVANLNYRALTGDEEACLDRCAGKLLRSNHRLMAAYVQLMPSVVQRRVADYEAANRATAPAAEDGDAGGPGPGVAVAATLPGAEEAGASRRTDPASPGVGRRLGLQ